MMTCEQCGNDYNFGKKVVKNNHEYIKCPYCGYLNNKVFRKKKGIRKYGDTRN